MRCVSLIVLAAVLAPPARAQTKAAKPVHARALAKEAEREALAAAKRDVFARMVSDRIARKGKRRIKKWLDGFQVIQSDHYLLLTNGPRTTVKKFATSLERLYAFVKKQWPFEDIDRLLTCYIFSQPDEYFDFCVKVRGWPRESARATAGHATSGYYATYYQSPKAGVVMHEATHQIVGACLEVPGIGSWFQEGMAVYIEKKIGNEKPSAGMRAAIRSGDFYHLRDFIAIRTLLSDPKGNGRRNYAHAGALIDFLNNTKLEPVKGRFGKFLDAARALRGRSRNPSEQLIRTVYGLSVDELEAVWAKSFGVKNARTRGERKSAPR